MFDTPSELELLGFFWSEPSEAVPEDGYWCYRVQDDRRVGLRFSFNVLERSVQTSLFVDGREVQVVAQEGAMRMVVIKGDDKFLRCEFGTPDPLGVEETGTMVTKGVVDVWVRPAIRVHWSTLVLP